jgi:hypothetical protein
MNSPIVSFEQVRRNSYASVTREACRQAGLSVGNFLVCGEGCLPNRHARVRFIWDYVGCHSMAVSFASSTSVYRLQCASVANPGVVPQAEVSVQDTKMEFMVIQSIHRHAINFDFVADFQGHNVGADDYKALFETQATIPNLVHVYAKLKEFNQSFISGATDLRLTSTYYSQFGGNGPMPTTSIDLFKLYQATLLVGGYYGADWEVVLEVLRERGALSGVSNPLHVQATYRAKLYLYEKWHVGPKWFSREAVYSEANIDQRASQAVAVATGDFAPLPA